MVLVAELYSEVSRKTWSGITPSLFILFVKEVVDSSINLDVIADIIIR